VKLLLIDNFSKNKKKIKSLLTIGHFNFVNIYFYLKKKKRDTKFNPPSITFENFAKLSLFVSFLTAYFEKVKRKR